MGPHLFLNINPERFTVEAGWKVWCVQGMRCGRSQLAALVQDLSIGNMACDLANTTLFATTFGEHFDVASQITSLVHDFLHALIQYAAWRLLLNDGLRRDLPSKNKTI